MMALFERAWIGGVRLVYGGLERLVSRPAAEWLAARALDVPRWVLRRLMDWASREDERRGQP